MRVLDLFSGIGGFSLGLERAGHRTIAFCEIDPYCRKVLEKHWPGVPCYDDVTTLTGERLAADGVGADCDTNNQNEPSRSVNDEKRARVPQYGGIDLICGGFPCQDISVVGKGAGIGGERSGLWSHYARIIGEVRPRYVIVENVAALLHRGIERVLGDLAALGFDAEWHCIPASAVGAPHRRDRIWIIAYPCGQRIFELTGYGDLRDGERIGTETQLGRNDFPARSTAICENGPVAYAVGGGTRCGGQGPNQESLCFSKNVAHPAGERLEGTKLQQQWVKQFKGIGDGSGEVSYPTYYSEISDGIRRGAAAGQWWTEPDVGRVAHGVPLRVDRLKSLGNAVVPQISEIIGRAILAADNLRYGP